MFEQLGYDGDVSEIWGLLFVGIFQVQRFRAGRHHKLHYSSFEP